MLDYLFSQAEPGTKLSRRSRFGLDRQWTDQGGPVPVDTGLAVIEYLAFVF